MTDRSAAGPSAAAPGGVLGANTPEQALAVHAALVGRAARRRGEREAPGVRGPADPVLVLMHRHRELCARAVDPLEIAAGLEAHGVTDRSAARYRHRDVFSLAEELYARVPRAPRDEPGPGDGRRPAPPAAARRIALHLLPGVTCAAGVALSHAVGAQPPRAAAVGAATLAAVALAARVAVRGGPLRAREARGSAVWTLWLLAFALYGAEAFGGGFRALLDPGAAAGFLGRAFAVLPAAWCADRYARRAEARLAESQDLGEFAAGARRLYAATLLLFTSALAGLVAAAYAALAATGGPRPDPVALIASVLLGVVLFTARLLAAHGFPAAGAAGCAAACVVEAIALATAAVRRLPGAAAVGRPLDALVRAGGPGAVQAVACGAAALALTAYAFCVLARACAHGTGAPTPYRPADAAHADRAALR